MGKGDEAPNHLCKSDAFSNVAISGDGTCYVGHTSGRLFALKDKNGNGKIDENLGEVSSFAGDRCYYGSPAIAPDLLAASPCNGLHVFIASDVQQSLSQDV